MSNDQKLREALQAFEKRGTGFDSCPTRRLPQSDEAKQIDQWWLRYFMDADLSVRELARQAIALPTAEQVDDINVAESFTSVTKTAAPVGERERFEKWASREGYLTTFEPNAMCSKGLPVYKDPRTHAAWWAWQARAALSAGDAVDAQRTPLTVLQYNAIPELCAIPPSLYESVVRAIERAHGIDAAMRKAKQ